MSFTNIHLNIDLSICNQFRSNVLHISQIKVFFFCVWKGGLATNKFDFRIFIIKEYQKNMPLISDKDTMSLEALTCMFMSLKMYFFFLQELQEAHFLSLSSTDHHFHQLQVIIEIDEVQCYFEIIENQNIYKITKIFMKIGCKFVFTKVGGKSKTRQLDFTKPNKETFKIDGLSPLRKRITHYHQK